MRTRSGCSRQLGERRSTPDKVDGEVNPADIFIKHSLALDRLMKLVLFFEGAFLEGRAESLPRMRTNPSGKTTIAEMNQVSRGDSDEDSQDKQAPPVMPHKDHTPQQLDLAYPSLTVPDGDDDHDHDYEEETEDPMLKEGTRIAKNVMEDAKLHGRRKGTGGGSSEAAKSDGPAVDAWRAC